MANHLRELVEFSSKGMNFRDCHRENIDACVRSHLESISMAESAICFDIGLIDNLNGITYKKGSVTRPPYERCWFEIKTQQVIWGCFLFENDQENYEEKIYKWVWYAKHNGDWRYQFEMQTYGIDHEHVMLINAELRDDETPMLHLRSAVLIFLCAIQCKNVKKVENKPDEKLQKARAKRGKKPLFSYWTLELTDQKTESGSARGGTHSSPRLHLRRGHPRQYKPGCWTWIDAMVVGNKKLGMVHKDYSFNPSGKTFVPGNDTKQ